MVSVGCLDVLVQMARSASQTLILLEKNRKNLDPSVMTRKKKLLDVDFNDIIKNEHDYVVVKKNCASALRSLTYNAAMRNIIANNGAIDIMLEDQGKDISINRELLRELETESWSNGCRGTKKEGRARDLLPGPLNLHLLKGTHNFELRVEIRTVTLEKYHVQVQVDEPQMDLDGPVLTLDLGIKDLASFLGDSDNVDLPVVCFCPKQYCSEEDVDNDPSKTLSRIERESLPFIEGLEPMQTSRIIDAGIKTEEVTRRSQDNIPLEAIKLPPIFVTSTIEESIEKSITFATSVDEENFPNPSTKSRSQLKSLRYNHSLKNNDKTFTKLLSKIKMSRQNKGADIDKVLETWRDISKY
jgi:hypothetical protein